MVPSQKKILPFRLNLLDQCAMLGMRVAMQRCFFFFFAGNAAMVFTLAYINELTCNELIYTSTQINE